MPIKFRCTHCKQFLGISREKAGAVVDCPTCGRSIRVPELDGRIEPVPEPRLVVDDPRLNEALDELAQLAAVVSAPDGSQETVLQDGLSEDAGLQATRLPDPTEPDPIEPQPIDSEDRSAAVEIEPVLVGSPAAEEIPTPLPAPEEELEPPAAVPVPRAEVVTGSGPGSESDADKIVDPLAELASLDVELPTDAVGGPQAAAATGRETSRNTWWIVLVAAGLAFASGWLIGRMERADEGTDVALSSANDADSASGRAAKSDGSAVAQQGPAAAGVDALAVTVQGRVLVPRSEGTPQPDRSARVLLVPHKRQGSLRLPPGGILSAQTHADYAIVAEGLSLMGGQLVTADADGQFVVRAEAAGNFWLVIVSQVEPLDDPRKLEPQALAALETCFEAPAKLLSQRRHHAVPLQLELGQAVEVVCRLASPAEHDTVPVK